MYNPHGLYPYHYQYYPAYVRQPHLGYWMNETNRLQLLPSSNQSSYLKLKDNGPYPFVVNINKAAKQNDNFRLALWTGNHLQVTLMSLRAGEEIGLEIHPHLDQFLRVEQGQGMVRMGMSKDNLNFVRRITNDSAIMVPAGTWHNLKNTGFTPLKLYSIYAPPQHPFGTIHATKAVALAEEH